MADADKRMLESEMQDVFVTDHKPIEKKFSTLSKSEDAEYYAYMRSLEDYNTTQMKGERVSQFESGRFERGSLKQRIFEPLAGATTLENGSLFYEVSEKELAGELNEDKLRATFAKLRDVEAMDAEDEADVRIAMYDAMESSGVDMEEWDKILAREFDTFKEGEKYEYVTDLRRTFDQGVSTSTADKIFKKLPHHVFWDIKKPLANGNKDYHLNPYNPARKYPFETFFDMRCHEDWLKSKEEMKNINANISKYTRI